MQTDFITPEEVIAALCREFPAFAVPESVKITPPREDDPGFKVVINISGAKLECQLYQDAWYLFFGCNASHLTAYNKPTLTEAMGLLRKYSSVLRPELQKLLQPPVGEKK